MARTALVTIATLLTLATLGVGLSDSLAADPAATGPILLAAAPVSAEEPSPPLTDQQQAAVDWAIGRYTAAGLELPEVAFRFDPTRETCPGNADGVYRRTGDDRSVTICTQEGDSFSADLERRRTLLHELAHAWDDLNLTGPDREGLRVVLGAPIWSGSDARWEDRGVERLAEAFVYSLLDQSLRQVKVPVECPALVSAFRLATGAEPVGPGLPWCADEAAAAGR